MEKSFSIKDIIQSVQKELFDAQEERIRKGVPPLFVVREFHIEAKVAVVSDETTKGGFNLKIITADQQDKVSESITHKVSLKLEIPKPEEQKEISEHYKALRETNKCPNCGCAVRIFGINKSVECLNCGYAKCSP